MSDEQFATLMGRLAVLEMTVAAQERVCMALALALPQGRRVNLLEMLNALRLNAATDDEAQAARVMVYFGQRFLALTGPNLCASPAQVKLCIAQQSALLDSAPPGRKDAMRSWLMTATPQELASDAIDLLKLVAAPPTPPPPPPGGPKKSGKRAPGGGG